MKRYESARVSAAMGFMPDLSGVESECLAVQSVIEEFRRELYTGTSDPDRVIPVMLERMREVGLDRAIAEIQRQLDDFVRRKNGG